MKEYRLMYRWGAWVPKARFYAESDAEAIFDADEVWSTDGALQRWPYEVALWCTDDERIVKTYKEANDGMYIRQE